MPANTIIYHSHHIFPKHIDPKGVFDSYRIKVTVKEHAEIHGLLFDEYWRQEDWIAWKILTGQIKNAEANKIISSIQGKKWTGRKHKPETKEKIRKWNIDHPENHTDEWRMKGINTWRGKKHTEETRRLISLKITGKPKSSIEKYKQYAQSRLWIVNKHGKLSHATNNNDPRIISGEYQLGRKWNSK